MDASLLANAGCGGICTQRVKGCKIGLQFVFQLYYLILYLYVLIIKYEIKSMTPLKIRFLKVG